MNSLSRDEIRKVFIDNGFTVKEGQTDLKEYVYAAAQALEKALLTKNGGGLVVVQDRLTNLKAGQLCEQKGYKPTGYLLADDHGVVCSVNLSNVQWFSADRPFPGTSRAADPSTGPNPLSDELLKEVKEALRDGLSVCNSVSISRDRRVVEEGCVSYRQTAEWCEWLENEVGPKIMKTLESLEQHACEQTQKEG